MILIVDDKKENIFSLKTLLESKNFDVDTALSGEEALKKVLKNDYALIILDVQMPGMDGFEVSETLSGYSKTKDIPVIFLSAINTDKRFIAKGYESGGVDYVTKPVDPDILLMKVRTFCRLQAAIESRNNAQEQLKNQVEYLHTILESLPQIAFTADIYGKSTFVNHKWFRYSPSSTSFPEVHPNDGNILESFQTDCIALNKPLEAEVRIKDIETGLF